MDVVLFLTALAVALWAGLGITLLIADPRPGRDPLGRIELVSLSLLLGLGAVSLLSFVAGMVLDGMTRAAVTLCCALLGAAGVRRGRHLLRAMRCTGVSGGAIVSAVVLAITGACVVWFARHQPLGWDGAMIWELKARLAFDHGGRIPRAYFQDGTRLWSHPTYPLFLPLSEAWFYSWWRRPDQHLIKLLFPLFFVAAAGMLHAGCARLAGNGSVRARTAAAVAPVLLLGVPMVVAGEGGAGSGYVDMPLAAIFVASVVHALHFARTGSAQSLRLAGVLAAVLPWAKQEGLVLFACVVAVLLCCVLRRHEHRARLAAWSVVPGLIVIGGWRGYLRHIDANMRDEYLPFTLTTLRDQLDRAPTIASSLWEEAVAWERWGLLWPAVLLATVVWVWRVRGPMRWALPVLVVLPMLLASGAYFFSGWEPVESHIDASLSRLVLQVAPVAVLLVALASTWGPAASWAMSPVSSVQPAADTTNTSPAHTGPAIT